MNIKKVLLFLYVISCVTNTLYPMDQIRQNSGYTTLKECAKEFALFYITTQLPTIFHELGHGAALKLLYNLPCVYEISLSPFSPGNAATIPLIKSSHFSEKRWKNILIYLAGPVSGIVTTYALTKLCLAYDPLLTLGSIIGLGTNGVMELCQLFPFKFKTTNRYGYSDGYRILMALTNKNDKWKLSCEKIDKSPKS